MKCPHCGFVFEEDIEDLKPMFRSAVQLIDKEWQIAQEQLETDWIAKSKLLKVIP